jgi:hypothetical protein
MLNPDVSLFIGAKTEAGYSGYIADNKLYLVLEVEEGLTHTKGEHFITHLKNQLLKADIQDLASFDSFLTEHIQKANLPVHFSLAAAYLKDAVVFLKTLGNGQIYLKRTGNFAEIIEGNTTASGYIQKNDFYILTSDCFSKIIGSGEDLKNITLKSDLYTIVDAIYNHIQEADDTGAISLFLQVEEKKETEVTQKENAQSEFIPPEENDEEEEVLAETEQEEIEEGILPAKVPSKFSAFIPSGGNKKKKLVTGAVVLVILAILVWSVGLGYQRRKAAEDQKKIQTYENKITEDLNKAESLSATDPSQSSAAIQQAKTDLDQFKNEFGKKKAEDIAAFEKMISDKENRVMKREDKLFTEFYNLNVEDKNAVGDMMYVDGDKGAIFDKKNAKVYILTFSKKSIDKRSATEMKDASLVGLYQDDLYLFVQDKGIFKVSDTEKSKKIIDHDDDWGTITDMKIYNGNIYLMDSSKNAIYKYLVAESGYSNKQSYFKSGEPSSLSDANSMSIDSALYIGFPAEVMKYSGGVQTDFATTYPDGGAKIQKVYTNSGLQKVYVWDKEKGVVFELEKNGQYDRQVQSSILTSGNDVVVIDSSIYILKGSQIFQIKI